MARKFEGKYYKKGSPDAFDTKAIAKKMRAEIAKLKRQGKIDKDVKISVKSTLQALEIAVKSYPESYDAEKLRKLRNLLDDVANYWNYDYSDVTQDLFDVNYYVRIEIY